jgi:prolyl oligopeptidase
MHKSLAILVVSAFVSIMLSSCSDSEDNNPNITDPQQMSDGSKHPEIWESDFLWLEEVEGQRALAWIDDINKQSLSRLKDDPRYDELRSAAEAVYTDSNRIPYGSYYGGQVHNFWQDETNVKGLVRRTSLDEYSKQVPEWDVLLDMDKLAADEGENWVYKGRDCLAPDYQRCLISLSRGGSDASEIREFDARTKTFVKDGFFIPEAKTRIDWLDKDHLLVATDLGEGSLTTSGYPRIVKKLKRGQKLEEAPTLLEVKETDTLVATTVIHRPDGEYPFIIGVPAFFREDIYFVSPDDQVTRVPFPEDIDFRGVFQGKVVGLLRSDWAINEATTLKEGHLIAIDLERSIAEGTPVDPQTIYAPTGNIAIEDIAVSRSTILVSVMEDVSGALLELRYTDGDWTERRVNLPRNGSIRLVTTDALSGLSMVNYESFLVPDTLYLINQGGQPEEIKSLPSRFDAAKLVSEQHFATSADGTRVPYYVVRAMDTKLDGSTPTLLEGYGGFEISRTPLYLSALGMEWLQSGGVYALGNIRGGGEYGPAWHKAALLENRQRSYDDFIAVSEALIETGITSPDKLGIRGGSNGGLLVTAVMVQRPDLYGAIICAVPLIDMLRYHMLSAGASWMAEYGNPDIPEQREYISKYSPYQNVKKDLNYPEVFFWTNTRDDRVHPSHARRMVAKMRSQGHEVLYFENTEGGHGGGADPLALAHTTALELVYLKQKLMD